MSLPREGITIDYFGSLLRKTILNPLLVVPAACGAASTLSSSVINPDWALRLNLARPFIYFTAAISVALKVADILNRGSNNNWTKDPTWNWNDEIVLITGGSRGIGASLAQQLLARNPATKIVIAAYSPLAWEAPKGSVHYYQCDLSDSSQLHALCDRIRREVGHPTVLVNNAGVCRGFTVCDGPPGDVEFTIRTNLIAPFLLVKEFLPEMVRRDHGHIVNMGSMSSLIPPSKLADYAATKAGLTALHEALQLELKNIHKAPRVRLTLGIFSFIHTTFFSGQTNQSHFLLPVLHVDSVAQALADTLHSGYGRTIYMPGIMYFIAVLKGGPEWLWRIIREQTKVLGLDFTGSHNVDRETGALIP